MNFLKSLKVRLQKSAAFQRFEKSVWPGVVKFIIAGPTLLGFVVGLTRYAPGEQAFECGFQSLLFFLAYAVSLTAVQAVDTLFFSQWPLVLGIARSFLAAGYLYVTLRQYLGWRSGQLVVLRPVQKLRDQLRAATGNAV